MAVPKFFEFFQPFLRALSDGEIHTSQDVREFIQSDMGLNKDDLLEMLPSGRMSTFNSRVGWARTYLDKAGLLETPSRAKYRITEEGKKALGSGKTIDVQYLKRYESFREFQSVTNSQSVYEIRTEEDGKSPIELMDDAIRQINASLRDQILTEVMKIKPVQFEILVVKFLLSMGYGDGTEDAGMTTRYSKDEGIDGMIKEDKLGFSMIYIQAKRWAPDRAVGRPEIQQFVGALTGNQIKKGIFITTARFSSDARKYVENLPGIKVILVDGEDLVKYMIQYNIGVSVDQVYEVKKVDSDFFEDML